MQEGPLLMTQADRDRLVTLKKAKKKLITQREAAEELGLSVRHVKRLLYELKRHGDKAVIHGLRGKSSNRKIEEKIEREAVTILSAHGAGSDVMRRIAAPMIGGIFTSFLLELLVYPAVYEIWKGFEIRRLAQEVE